ncbi:hypothetical protein DSO57_1019313 [Entomophthora muscae]|uniref:Uncharacterized protein n=1 Tax=Entomophthora muscae TaxID=34485 RepID=A0ACC2TRB9_9FUNG|nr:hypothetical protein DSO57_1019313 [Entomophthora muscae]
MKDPEGHLARWAAKLQNYDFNVVHRPGNKQGNANALSRLPLVAALQVELDSLYELIGQPEKCTALAPGLKAVLEKLSRKTKVEKDRLYKRCGEVYLPYFRPLESIRINNSSSLETWDQEQESNSDPGPPWAARPVDHLPAIFMESTPYKLIPRMLARAVKQAKPRKLLHQMED